jgi:hypothetical protein
MSACGWSSTILGRACRGRFRSSAGGTIVRPVTVADWGGTTGAFADPEGYVWEVAHNPAWTISDDGTVHI